MLLRPSSPYHSPCVAPPYPRGGCQRKTACSGYRRLGDGAGRDVVSALLRQPRGFEGFCHLVELINTRDLALAQRIDLVVAGIDRDPAFSASSLVMRDQDNLVPGVDDFVDRDPEFFKGSRERSGKSP
jgi:hypothetical protein